MKYLKWIAKKFANYFLRGIILAFPVGVTVWAVIFVFTFLDGLLPTGIPGLSIAIILGGFAFLGFLASTFLEATLLSFFDKTLEKIPLIKVIYTSVRDLLSAFVGKEKRFSKPVLVKLSKETEIYKLGFVTQKDLKSIGIAEGMSAVYLPHSYNFSGNLIIVKNELIQPINAPSDEIMKFIVSGGITSI
jgi:uncharacterized membrane protein